MAKKYLDENGLLYVWQKIKNKFVWQENGKGLSSNDYTTNEKNKLAGIEAGATKTIIDATLSTSSTNPVQNAVVTAAINNKVDKETGKGLSTNDLTNDLKAKYDTAVSKVDELTETGGAPNVIEIVKVNGTALTPDSNKAVNVVVPTKTSELTNDDNVVKDANYVHTDNNYTTTEKNKLAGLSNYDDTEIKNQIAQAGKIDVIKVNGTAQTVTNKTVSLTIPTNNNQLENGAGYITGINSSDVTNALGFTPYSATNPNGYQTESQVSGAITEATGSINEVLTALDGQVQDIEGRIPTNNNQLTNGAGYQTASDVNTAIEAVVGAAPDALNTLKELADALGNDKDFAATMTTELAKKVNDADLIAITNDEIDHICWLDLAPDEPA